MECQDRIAVQMTDLVLQPVRLLAELSLLSAVTIRAFRGGRRFHITIGKEWSHAEGTAAVYWWRLRETDVKGAHLLGGYAAESGSETPPTHEAPEDAYWAAVEALSGADEPLPVGARRGNA